MKKFNDLNDGEYKELLRDVLDPDVFILLNKRGEYGDSWCSRGGVGAFMMLARKWDRLENQLKVEKYSYDIFKAGLDDKDLQGIMDDIGDLRRYLALVQAWIDNQRELEDDATAADIADDEVDPSRYVGLTS